MRITQNSLKRNYFNRMSTNFNNLYKSNEKLSSQSNYNRVSDNTAQTSRAFQIRENLYHNEQWNENMSNAQGELNVVEDALMTAESYIKDVNARLVQACNGTVSPDQRKMIGEEIRVMRDQMIQVANTKFGDKYVFANSGRYNEPPFDINGAGKLTFNGYVVDDMVKNPATGNIAVPDNANPPQLVDINYNKDIYIDVGIGMNMSGYGADVEVDTKSMFKLSTSGIEAFGYGVDEHGNSKNIISELTKIVEACETSDMETLSASLERLKVHNDSMLMNLTDIGVRTRYLEDAISINEEQNINFKEVQNSIEAVNLAEEMVNNKVYEMSWMVTLQMGSKLIPPSIFDFMR